MEIDIVVFAICGRQRKPHYLKRMFVICPRATKTSPRTGNRARKNNDNIFPKNHIFIYFLHSATNISASLFVPNFRARIWQNSRYVLVVGSFQFCFFSSRLFFCMRSVRALRLYRPVPRCAKTMGGHNSKP